MPSNQLDTSSSQPEVLSRAVRFAGVAAKLAPVGKARDLYARVRRLPAGFRLESLLASMQIELQLNTADQARIPLSGPVVVVANHPYGVLDGAALTVLLSRVRPDVKLLTNFLLADIPELQQHSIFVDPFKGEQSVHANRQAVREALMHLKSGGMLAIFPAGEVSRWQMPEAQITDPEWNDTAARLIRRTGASALPMYFCGHNSVGFQILGMMHPRLRAAFLLHEFLQQEGKRVEVRVGSAIPADALDALPSDREVIEYLRWRTYLLDRRRKQSTSLSSAIHSQLVSRFQQPLAAASPAQVLAAEIANIPQANLLVDSGDLAVYAAASASDIPQVLLEIGRLRELTFRGVGEGTGKARDLDDFDQYYLHILLWNKRKQEVVGAYRAGNSQQILQRHGIDGLYTSTLFRYHESLFRKLGPALELGRSFVRPEYQRQYAPLLLLWKGIARFVAAHPETPVLFGAVSISNSYCAASREVIYRYFESRMQDDELKVLVQPRRAFRPGSLRPWDCRSMNRALRDVEDLSEPIADLEADGKGVPVLLRQYAKVGGKMLGFNVDRKFSNVLDGLVLVDLRQTEESVLEKYMGHEGVVGFRNFHGLSSSCAGFTSLVASE